MNNLTIFFLNILKVTVKIKCIFFTVMLYLDEMKVTEACKFDPVTLKVRVWFQLLMVVLLT